MGGFNFGQSGEVAVAYSSGKSAHRFLEGIQSQLQSGVICDEVEWLQGSRCSIRKKQCVRYIVGTILGKWLEERRTKTRQHEATIHCFFRRDRVHRVH